MKGKNGDRGKGRSREFQNGNCWYTPGSLRKGGKQKGRGIRNLEEWLRLILPHKYHTFIKWMKGKGIWEEGWESHGVDAEGELHGAGL